MREISNQDIRGSLAQDNPWWQTGRNPFVDHIRKRRAYFKPFAELATNHNIQRSIILMGPRRVGKTIMLHQLVESALEDQFDPKCILFASIDTPLYSAISLEQLLELFVRESGHEPHDRRIVIFDEIQYLKDWEIALKSLTDRYPNTRFVASGSAAAALRLQSQESGAGRFTDFFLPPLTFAEFLDFRELEEELITSYHQENTVRYTTQNIIKLNHEFLKFLNFGGYPEAVLNVHIQSNIKRFLGRDIVDKVLLRDLPSLYGIQDIQELNRLFTAIAYNTGLEISLNELAQSSGVAKNTISKYLDYLEAAFLIARVRRIDDSGRVFKRVRNFKAYLTNPSMRSALFSDIDLNSSTLGQIVETAVLSHWFHSDLMRNIHYARWKAGRATLETDLVGVNPATRKPIWAYEIKWSDRHIGVRKDELRGLVMLARKNDIAVGVTSKTVTTELDCDDVRIQVFPCALHCYQIGKNLALGYPP